MTQAEDNITEFPKPEVQDITSKQFYDSIDMFHKKVRKLNEIIVNYYYTRGLTCEREFFAVQFQGGKIHDMVDSIYHDINNIEVFKEVFEFWFEHKDNSEFIDNVYKVEIENKVFLFQFFSFDNNENEGVVAGYFIKNSIDTRLLLLSLSNAVINSNYRTIASFMK